VKTPRITLTDLAVADILEQADWYEAQADRKLAKRWEEAVTSTLLRLGQHPAKRMGETGRPPRLSF